MAANPSWPSTKRSCTGEDAPMEPGNELLSLQEVFTVIGDQLTPKDVRLLKFLYGTLFSEDLSAHVVDGQSFLLAMESIGRIDESNFKHLHHLLKVISRHDLLQFLTLRKRKTGNELV